jgi:hypothetical protein
LVELLMHVLVGVLVSAGLVLLVLLITIECVAVVLALLAIPTGLISSIIIVIITTWLVCEE